MIRHFSPLVERQKWSHSQTRTSRAGRWRCRSRKPNPTSINSQIQGEHSVSRSPVQFLVANASWEHFWHEHLYICVYMIDILLFGTGEFLNLWTYKIAVWSAPITRIWCREGHDKTIKRCMFFVVCFFSFPIFYYVFNCIIFCCFFHFVLYIYIYLYKWYNKYILSFFIFFFFSLRFPLFSNLFFAYVIIHFFVNRTWFVDYSPSIVLTFS